MDRSRTLSQSALASAAARLPFRSVLSTLMSHPGRPFSDQRGTQVRPTYVGFRQEGPRVDPITFEYGDGH